MDSESLRIADQLRRAFTRDAWHGSPVIDLLGGISPDQAQARPLPSVHNIQELVVHIDFWVNAALEATRGVKMPPIAGKTADWPSVSDPSAEGWFTCQDRLFHHVEELARAVERLDDAKLPQTVPGREYDFYRLFHGVVQHSLYHAGQIAMLKKAISAE